MVDVNECDEGVSECQAFTDCINIVGSYKCSCKSGYFGNGLHCEGNVL